MIKFELGDLVILRSGGPVMTISYETTDEYIQCDWFNDRELKHDAFHPNELIKVSNHVKSS